MERDFPRRGQKKKKNSLFLFFKFRSQNVYLWVKHIKVIPSIYKVLKIIFKAVFFSIKSTLKTLNIFLHILPNSSPQHCYLNALYCPVLSSTKPHEYLCTSSPRFILKNLCFLMLSRFAIETYIAYVPCLCLYR